MRQVDFKKDCSIKYVPFFFCSTPHPFSGSMGHTGIFTYGAYGGRELIGAISSGFWDQQRTRNTGDFGLTRLLGRCELLIGEVYMENLPWRC